MSWGGEGPGDPGGAPAPQLCLAPPLSPYASGAALKRQKRVKKNESKVSQRPVKGHFRMQTWLDLLLGASSSSGSGGLWRVVLLASAQLPSDPPSLVRTEHGGGQWLFPQPSSCCRLCEAGEGIIYFLLKQS